MNRCGNAIIWTKASLMPATIRERRRPRQRLGSSGPVAAAQKATWVAAPLTQKLRRWCQIGGRFPGTPLSRNAWAPAHGRRNVPSPSLRTRGSAGRRLNGLADGTARVVCDLTGHHQKLASLAKADPGLPEAHQRTIRCATVSSDPHFEFERKPGSWRIKASGSAVWGISVAFGIVLALLIGRALIYSVPGH